MIRKISANHPTFHTTEFQPGMNIILADKTSQSTKNDSRNGLGKSTLIEIMHFLLGAEAPKPSSSLSAEQLRDWVFSLDWQDNAGNLIISRSLEKPWIIHINSKDSDDGKVSEEDIKTKELCFLLGQRLYGLSAKPEAYTPSFRALISYAIRRGNESYNSHKFHVRRQQEWDAQLHLAFLLGLRWEDAVQLQKYKTKDKGLKDLHKAVRAGVLQGYSNPKASLVADRATLSKEIDKLSNELESFKVLENYRKIQDEADILTQDIHKLTNDIYTKHRLLQTYQENISQENQPQNEEVGQLYNELGIHLPELVCKRFEDVQAFHVTMVANRKQFLSLEMQRLEESISKLEQEKNEKADRRTNLLSILKTHGALEEYSRLQEELTHRRESLAQIDTQIANLDRLQTSSRQIKREREESEDSALEDFRERRPLVEQAAAIFSEYFEYLYGVPGRLIIDYKEGKGFQFDLEGNPRSGSNGVDTMKIFCFDLLLARLWAQKNPSPRLLVHDSQIFDPVDERQVAKALELATKESKQWGFQYICFMNTDRVPLHEFQDNFSIEPYVRLRLTDQYPADSLLGIRF